MSMNNRMNQNLAIVQVLLSKVGQLQSLLGNGWAAFRDELDALLARLLLARTERELDPVVDDLIKLLNKTPLRPFVQDALKPLVAGTGHEKGIDRPRGSSGGAPSPQQPPSAGMPDVIGVGYVLAQALDELGPSAATAESEQRYFNTFFALPGSSTEMSADEPLVYDQLYDLYIDISPQLKGPDEVRVPFPAEKLQKLWKKHDLLPITVWVASHDFEIRPQIQELHLPPKGASESVHSTVRPLIREGRGRIQVELFYQGCLLQSKRIEALVMPGPDMPAPSPLRPAQTARITFTTLESIEPNSVRLLPERLLTINVERDPNDASLDIRLLDRTAGDARLAHYNNHLQPQAFGKAVSDVRRQLLLAITGIHDGQAQPIEGYEWKLEADAAMLDIWLPRLANAGRSLYRTLMTQSGGQPPDQDQGERLGAALRPGAVIQVNPVLGMATFPWALLYERELRYIPGRTRVCKEFVAHEPDCAGCPSANDSGIVCPYAFWGYRYAIEQIPCWVTDETPQLPTLIRKIANGQPLLLNLNVWNQFALWRDHRAKLQSAGQVQVMVAEDAPQLEAIWQSHNAELDLVYFYTHGGVDDEIGPYLELSDARVGSNYLEASHLKWPHAPLVYLSGCSTGDYGPDSYLSLINDFRGAGASSIIGSECPVPELFAEAYASALLPRLFRGERLGQAMRQVRLEFLRKNHNPLGLVYALYAANDVTLIHPVSHS